MSASASPLCEEMLAPTGTKPPGPNKHRATLQPTPGHQVRQCPKASPGLGRKCRRKAKQGCCCSLPQFSGLGKDSPTAGKGEGVRAEPQTHTDFELPLDSPFTAFAEVHLSLVVFGHHLHELPGQDGVLWEPCQVQ